MRTSQSSLKNRAAYGGRLLDMNGNTYAMRKEVMSVIYQVLRKGYNIPRVEVRVVSTNTDAAAYAYLGMNIVHMNERYTGHKLFVQIVLHELVHAVFGVGEVVGCPLMHCSKFWDNKVSESDAWELFDRYYTKHKA